MTNDETTCSSTAGYGCGSGGDSDACPDAPTRPLDPARRRLLGRRAQLLAGASVAYNVVEAVVSIAAGAAASSAALVGFGLDSTIEMFSGLVILWQFRHAIPEEREEQALKAIGVSFFLLAAYVTWEAGEALWHRHAPDSSTLGVAIAALSLIVMPFLSWAQRRTGRELSSGSVVADSTQTLLCTYLSAVLLVGLLLNMAFGWWWADPVAALVIAAVAVHEGRETWEGESCGCGPAVPGSDSCGTDACGDTTTPSTDDACRSNGTTCCSDEARDRG
ncbi:cation diffusion facilitator family transporter [Mobilicoccus pelagius]|uniref:Cation efflux protein transmembrane domain-containing protein n=1 Tax=Mobilicoccus pelagius NBRC 104925 TaxID=1089455 RepID=H5UNN2_9MICO|nr:cation transporter [Mobilicoccus pelagius]GAB47340.1 hypothetical protein MOPEL_009_00300 [Mobilicoccus pelagius NBRC 104925]